MFRWMIALCAVAVSSRSGSAQIEPPGLVSRTSVAVQTPATRAATADIVFVGKVTAVEKDEVEVSPAASAAQKVSYRVAVVQVADGLTDTGGLTHVKVGFQPSGVSNRPTAATFDVKENAEGLFFLKKHPSGSFYVYAANSQPIDAAAKTYKEDLELARKTIAALTDPMKALKGKEAKDRYFAAAILVQKYRTPATPGATARTEAVAADESKLLLQAILDADWANPDTNAPPPLQTFTKLGLTAKDKWQPPAVNAAADRAAQTKDEFKKWLEGDGKAYQVQKYVAK